MPLKLFSDDPNSNVEINIYEFSNIETAADACFFFRYKKKQTSDYN